MSVVPSMLRPRLGVVTDEVDLDIAVAAERIRDWGIFHADIRSVGGYRAPLFDESTVRHLVLATAGISIGALSPGLFKGALRGRLFEHERDVLLPNTLQLATRLGVRQVIVFGGGRDERMADVLAVLEGANARASESAIELLVENSSLCRVAASADLAEVAERLGIRVVWDPANAIAAGEDDLAMASRSLARAAACVHVRDWSARHGWRRVGEGSIPWNAVVADLESAGFSGRYVIESHLPDDPGASRWNVEAMVGLLSDGT